MRVVTATRSFLAVLVFFGLGCAGSVKKAGDSAVSVESTNRSDAISKSERFEEPSIEILPSPDRLEEYTTAEERELFVGQELYELINGGAVQFFNHGFEWATAAGYQRVGGDRVTVHVYRMSSPAAAAALFAERTLGEAVPAVVGERSSIPGSSFDFCREACYVTLVSFEAGEPGKQSTLALARAIDAHLMGE